MTFMSFLCLPAIVLPLFWQDYSDHIMRQTIVSHSHDSGGCAHVFAFQIGGMLLSNVLVLALSLTMTKSQITPDTDAVHPTNKEEVTRQCISLSIEGLLSEEDS